MTRAISYSELSSRKALVLYSTPPTNIPVYSLWVDGKLDPPRIAKLLQEKNLVRAEEYEFYTLAWFSKPPFFIREYLSPARFVLQMNSACTHLELNFNPSEAEMKSLREFLARAKTMRLPQ